MLKAKVLLPMVLSFLDYPTNDHCISIFFVGCDFSCYDCSNKQLINGESGVELDTDTLVDVINGFSAKAMTKNIALLGGDPLSSCNLQFTKELLSKLDGYSVCVYTGHTVDYVKGNDVRGFEFVKTGTYDVLKYIGSSKWSDHFQLASSNQELYDSNFNLLTKNGRYEF